MFQLKSSECNYVMLFRFFSESEKLMSEGVPNDSGDVGNSFKKKKKTRGRLFRTEEYGTGNFMFELVSK